MTANSSYDSAFNQLVAAGAKVHLYSATAPLYIHAKVIDVDAALTSHRDYVGSINFSDYSLNKNRELGFITLRLGDRLRPGRHPQLRLRRRHQLHRLTRSAVGGGWQVTADPPTAGPVGREASWPAVRSAHRTVRDAEQVEHPVAATSPVVRSNSAYLSLNSGPAGLLSSALVRHRATSSSARVNGDAVMTSLQTGRTGRDQPKRHLPSRHGLNV